MSDLEFGFMTFGLLQCALRGLLKRKNQSSVARLLNGAQSYDYIMARLKDAQKLMLPHVG